jgi:dephospho-CoA kinase
MPITINIPILFVTGLSCSGKGEFLNIARSMSLLCIEWSQVLGSILECYGRAESREKALNMIENIVKEKGTAYFPNRILISISKQIADSPNKYKGVVVSGARNPEEIRILARSFVRSLVVILHANYYVRYQRSKKRGRTKDPIDIERFVQNDFGELHTGIAEIADEMAQKFIFNDGEFSEFTIQVKELLKFYFCVDDPSEDYLPL